MQTHDGHEPLIGAAEACRVTLTAFVGSPATALALASLKEQSGSDKALLGSDPTQPTSRGIAGLPLYTSPAIIADGIVRGIPEAHSIFVVQQDVTVVTDTSVYFTSDRVAVRATLRIGFGFTYPGRRRQGQHHPVSGLGSGGVNPDPPYSLATGKGTPRLGS